MEVICEKYITCMARHDSDFNCHHSKPHKKLDGDICNEKGSCGECNHLLLRKLKLKKLEEINDNRG